MSISPATTLPLFEAAFASYSLLGSSVSQLAAGCATGLFTYLTSSGCQAVTIDVGTLGAGTGIGLGVLLPQTVLTPSLMSMFSSYGINGAFSPAMASAISMGISTSLATAQISSVNIGVGTGVGKLQLIPTGSGQTIFGASFLASGMKGSMNIAFGNAVGLALDSVISASIGAVAIVGLPTLLAGSGVGTASLS